MSGRPVAEQFVGGWKHPTSKPTVVKIWRVCCEKAHNDKFSRYKLAVERRTNLPGGNSHRRWHGTARACLLGDNEQEMALCLSPSCSLCGILRSSFQVSLAGRATAFQRFGRGIYASATSSKANDYVQEIGGSPYRAMLLNDVVVGNGKKMFNDDLSLTQPPSGFDSVLGEPGGGSLNYDETVVYRNDAIRPMFLIIYRS
ncbi:uncharacterized protein FIBRA_00301 [Fibroporia radiculosa]|uniref:PARP catalytic domain-containing protein n=1 Tax=Fibroporia radiculosa TaxID=599839 RepID=J7RGU8_9APHY|nr:uncharacterized protein FIBRA_00301 [Fibroporia radiculosa]CCL98307.1 predicted protein [Fibroporia radiculosa]